MWKENILQTIGGTPLIRLNRLAQDSPATILAKVEYFNPGQSTKDRIAIKMIEDAEKAGLLRPGGTIIEATSGNTGLGLAIVAAVKGYRCIFTIPDKQSKEKIDILRALGAEVIVTPTEVPPDDPRSYYSVARRLAQEIPNSFYPNQYDNLSNRQAHYETTGPEIWNDTKGEITHFVAGMGTTGTICGVAQYLKEKNPAIRVIGVDTYGSLFQKLHQTGQIDPKEIYPYLTEGIGEDIVPANLDMSLIDEIIKVTDKDAALMARKLARMEGIFAGWSSGSAVWAALQVAKRASPKDLIVVLLPDHGTRYLKKIYNDTWMQEKNFLEVNPSLTAADVLSYKPKHILVYVHPDDPLEKAIYLMEVHSISQIPVLNADKEPIGVITESQVLQVLIDHPQAKTRPVQEYMAKPLPAVLASTPIDILSKMLTQEMPAVMVQIQKGSWEILTRADLIHHLSQLA
ncbi:MAG: pyridoxal-phosphate dependent enzyme [Bacteroidia bacterium]